MIAGGPGKIPRSEACWPCRFSWWPACPGQCGVLASTWSRFSTCTQGLWGLDWSCCHPGHSVSKFIYSSNSEDTSAPCLSVWDSCLPSLSGLYSFGYSGSLDSGSYSKLFWFSPYELEHDGITAHEMANSLTPSVPAYTQRPPLSRWLLFVGLLFFVWTNDGNALVKR